MESKVKLRISRMFRASFGSCRSRNISDVMLQSHPLPPPKPKPKQKTETINSSCSSSSVPRRKKVSYYSPFIATNGRICPPTTPISPDTYYYNNNKNKKKKTKRRRRDHNSKRFNLLLSSSSSRESFKGCWWSSTDDENEKETLLSSSCYSDSFDSQMGVAVVKSSRDPYSDFRTSMVEMIIEKQIFSAKDLDYLLHCFLSLNSPRHHTVILDVFTEIYQALFSSM